MLRKLRNQLRSKIVRKPSLSTDAEIDDIISKVKSTPHVKITKYDVEVGKLAGVLANKGIESAKNAVQAFDVKKRLADEVDLVVNQWQQLQARVAVYAPLPLDSDSVDENAQRQQFNAKYVEFNKLYQSSQLKNIMHKLKQSLLAFQEQSISTGYDEAKMAALMSAMVELKKIEIAQLEILEQQQQYNRSDVVHKKEVLEAEKKRLHNFIENRKKKFSQQMQEHQHNAVAFFQRKESHFHYANHLKKTEKISVVIKALKLTGEFILHLLQGNPAAWSIVGSAAGAVLSVTPIISPVLILYPTIVDAIKYWKKRKNLKSIAITSGLLLVIMGVIAAAALIPVATAGIVAATVILTTGIQMGIPWIKSLQALAKNKQQLEACDNELNSDKRFPLTELQKRILLQKLQEKTSAIDFIPQSPQELLAARQLIIAGNNKEAILNNHWIKAIIGNSTESSYNKFMRSEIGKQKELLQNDTQVHKKAVIKNSISLASGVIAIVGAVLMCIPPTALIGLGLFVGTALINVAVKLKLVDRILNKLIKTEKSNQPALTGSDNIKIKRMGPALQTKPQQTPKPAQQLGQQPRPSQSAAEPAKKSSPPPSSHASIFRTIKEPNRAAKTRAAIPLAQRRMPARGRKISSRNSRT